MIAGAEHIANQPETDDATLAAREVWATAARFFLAPIRELLDDPSVTEIMVNGPSDVFVERAGRIDRVAARFRDEDDVFAAAQHIAQFVGRRLGTDRPILDGRLPSGDRVCVVLGPIAACGTTITIRKFNAVPLSLEELVARGTLTDDAADYLIKEIATHRNLVISGGTGTGKTTVVSSLIERFCDAERIVVIEDTRELRIEKPHAIRLEARPADRRGRGEISIRDLFIASLRMRPDRIVVGEVRRGEALDMIQAMTSGHRGVLSTLHANSPIDACRRLETMALMADVAMPMVVLRQQIASAVDTLVQIERAPDGRRRVSHISHVELDASETSYRVRHAYALDASTNRLVPVAP